MQIQELDTPINSEPPQKPKFDIGDGFRLAIVLVILIGSFGLAYTGRDKATWGTVAIAAVGGVLGISRPQS